MAKTGKRNAPEHVFRSNWDISDAQAILVIVIAVGFFFRDILLQNAFFWEDFLYQFYPFRNFAAVSMANGELPLWNPFTFCGVPFQADIQSALFYVPNLLLTFFVSGGKLHFYWLELMIVLHFMLAGVCMYYLVKSFGFRRLHALFSGLVYALSGFMIVHAIHQVIICQVAWLPLVVLLFRKALAESSMLHMILAGLVLGHAVLAGFPQLTLYIFFFLFLLFLFEFVMSVRDRGWKLSVPMVPIAGGAIVIALLITALQLLPTMELAPLSQRAEISYAKSLEGSISWERLITLVMPKYFGSSGADASSFWLQKPSWEYWETCVYLGVVALVLITFAVTNLKRNRTVAFYSAIIVFAVLYALGDDFILHKIFFFNAPGFSKFRNPARMSLLIAFSGSILCAFGLQRLTELCESNKRKVQKFLLVMSAIGLILWIAAQQSLFQPQNNPQLYKDIHATAMSSATTAMVFLLLACGIVVLWMRRSISPLIAVFALFLLQFIDMNVFGFGQNNSPQNPAEYFNRPAQLISSMQQNSDDKYVRINSRKGGAMLLDRNQGMVDRIFLLEGYTPLALQRVYPPAKDWDHVCDMLNARFRIVADEKTQSAAMGASTTYLPRAFCVYRDTIIQSEPRVQAFMASDLFNPRQTVVFEENPNMNPDSLGTGSAAITSYGLNVMSLKVTSSSTGFLVLSEIFYPGWKATVDGVEQPVFRADWSLRAVPIVAGTHQVELRFEPGSFRRGLWISLGTLGLAAISIPILLRRKKSQGTKHSNGSDQPIAPVASK